MADKPTYPGIPRWVKVFGIIGIVVVLLIVILLVAGGPGGHGPGRHLPSGDGSYGVDLQLAALPVGLMQSADA